MLRIGVVFYEYINSYAVVSLHKSNLLLHLLLVFKYAKSLILFSGFSFCLHGSHTPFIKEDQNKGLKNVCQKEEHQEHSQSLYLYLSFAYVLQRSLKVKSHPRHMHNGCSKRESSRIKRVNLLGFSLLKYEQIAYNTFHLFKRWLPGFGKYSLCYHRKQPVESTKQPVVLPLTPLNEIAIIAYEWLKLFMLFKVSCWSNMQYVCLRIWS